MARIASTGQQVRDVMTFHAVTENKHRFLGILSALDIVRAVAEG